MNEETARGTKCKGEQGGESQPQWEEGPWREKELGQIWASSETGHIPFCPLLAV